MAKPKNDVVIVRSAQKRYGKGQANVLDGLDMTVPRGCIYGLLGASGCGKTTLLSCIVGVCKLDSGDLWVSGGKPGSKDSCVPGRYVGYMPQDISLVPEMSVIGSLYYFGRINGLEDSVIDERFDFLSELLELPPRDRLIKSMSGGQQRRVSFAAALIHRPELLILDEPTVGLDSVLRDKIWRFLVRMTREEGVTVIITTHYIEETRQADRIGLMRCGRLLTETTPTRIIERFDSETLEEAFLELSRQQEDDRLRGVVTEVMDDVATVQPSIAGPSSTVSEDCIAGSSSRAQLTGSSRDDEKSRRPSFGKVFKALMIKNLLQFLRYPGGILFAFIFPTVQVSLFFVTVGNDPRGVVVAVVNEEAGNCDHGRYLGSVTYDPDDRTCGYKDISCTFLHEFNETIMIKQYYDTLDEALSRVRGGKAYGVIHFRRNFSSAFQLRREDFGSLSDDEIVDSQIHARLDMGDRQIGLWLQKKLLDRFVEAHGNIVSRCNISKRFADKPIFLEEPIFGRPDPKYSDYMAPGFLLSICFFLATAVSSSIIISDRAEGVWDRSLVQGVKSWTILLTHILTQIWLITIQVSMVLCVTFAYFRLACVGSFGYAVALIWLVSFMGMCYGFLISCVCKSHTLSNMAAVGSFYPLVLLCGCIWPTESMPGFLYYVSLCMPVTLPSFALRSILEKGFPLHDPEVFGGFVVVLAWSGVFLVCCLIGLTRSKS